MRPPTATAIVEKFLALYGKPVRVDEPRNAQGFLIKGPAYEFADARFPLTAENLTVFAWDEFREVPTRSAIRNALATLQALARPREEAA